MEMSDIDDNNDDIPQLSKETLSALQEFLKDQSSEYESDIKENWQLSQFWYDDDTVQHLSRAAVSLCTESSKIALISCPSLYKTIKSLLENEKKMVEVKLFEFDKRFSRFEPDFIFYDYNSTLSMNSKYGSYFDVILVDPPFLSEECLKKTVETIKFIGNFDYKVVLCTGAVMESLAAELLNLKKCSFQPSHKNNLANEFICLTNFGELNT